MSLRACLLSEGGKLAGWLLGMGRWLAGVGPFSRTGGPYRHPRGRGSSSRQNQLSLGSYAQQILASRVLDNDLSIALQ
jgi:hypothetical protein